MFLVAIASYKVQQHTPFIRKELHFISKLIMPREGTGFLWERCF
jgi:hypothetical protein